MTVIVYGATPSVIFEQYEKKGINILKYECEFNKSRKVEV